MVKKIDGRKKVKITIEVTGRDLCNFEDHMHCIPLCNKHKGIDYEKQDERESMTMHYECKDCDKVWRKWVAGAQRIESRLWEQFEKECGL